MTNRVLLTGGGTGGSVGPLLALAVELRRRQPGVEFLFIGSQSGPEASLCEAAGIPFKSIPAGKLRRYWSWTNMTDLGRLWTAYWAARRIVAAWQPTVVVAAGSFVAVPVVWAAHQQGSKVLIHQQDLRPGLANRLMAGSTDIITVAFEKSLRDFPKRKTHLVGNPVREEINRGSGAEGQKIFSLTSGVPTVLVVGGGTGSEALNQLISATAFRIVRKWQIIHITGQRTPVIALHDDRYHQYQFLTWQYPHAVAAADLVITRAGLGAISELAAVGKPAIFVPLPNTHQLENAQVIKDVGGGLVVSQHEMTENKLLELLDQFRHDPKLATQWSTNIRRLAHPKALAQMTQFILELMSE